MTFVYLIRCGTLPYYKIGISDNPQERLEALQVANPLRLYLLMTCGFPTKVAAKLAESNVHLSLSAQNIWNEWFELSKEQVECLKCDMIKAGA